MTKVVVESAGEPLEIDLKDQTLAAVLAWLIPGVGHLYQRRTAKGILFMVCILGTFFFGLWLGQGRVVYASWRPDENRLAYYCQVGTGAVALPALIQSFRVRNGKAELFGGLMAPPQDQVELAQWHKDLHRYFELGTVYTMIAGLLNILAIYDAWGGPVQLPTDEKKKKPEPEPDEAEKPPA